MSSLYILPTFIGDCILMASGIIDQFKDESSMVVANPQTAPLFEDLPNMEKLIVLKRKPWNQHWIDVWRETRGQSWDRIINFRKAGLPYFLKTKKHMVWQDSAESPLHIVQQVTDCFGYETPLSPTLWLSPERLARTKPKRPTFAVAPIPGWKGKQWPLENFKELLQKFCKAYPEAQVAVFVAPHEVEIIQSLVESLPKDQYLDTRGWPLLECAALIHSSCLFLGNDSGLMHVSAAVNTPTIALFGPSNEKIFGPFSAESPSPHRVIRGEPFTGNIRQVKETEHICYMTSLSVPQVWGVVQEMWDLHANKGGSPGVATRKGLA
jgi:ADP-heptose:LPS heptosyltransferase